jgi:hypothetical protein
MPEDFTNLRRLTRGQISPLTSQYTAQRLSNPLKLQYSV